MKITRSAFLFASACSLLVSGANAATNSTASLQTKMTINSACEVVSAGNLDFGQSGLLSNTTNTNTTLSVACSKGTPFVVALDGGVSGGDTATRLMTSGSETIAYKIYSDSARTANWGNTAGTDAVSGTGTGSNQTLTLYGSVEAQNTPAPGSYADTVTVTLTY